MLLRFFVSVMAASVVVTVVYNGTGGSIPVAFLFHWIGNLPYPWETGADISTAGGLLWVAVPVVLILTLGRRYLGRENLYTDVTPGAYEPV